MTLAALGENKAPFCLVCLGRILEGPIHGTLRRYCSTSYKSHGGGTITVIANSSYFIISIKERGEVLSLADIRQGPRGGLEKPFILVRSSYSTGNTQNTTRKGPTKNNNHEMQ